MNTEKLHGLYAITDQHLIPEQLLLETVSQALSGGAKIIQYRNKNDTYTQKLKQAKALKEMCIQYNSILIINDDLQLAKEANADGIHIGKNDVSVQKAINYLNEGSIIGVSCYGDINLALDAQKNGADYVAFGACYASSTKKSAKTININIINSAKEKLNIPVCAIGGITIENAQEVISLGADMIAVISGLFSKNDIQSTARKLSASFNSQT